MGWLTSQQRKEIRRLDDEERHAHYREQEHYERSAAAWDIAEARGMTWEQFRRIPLPRRRGDAGPVFPWPHSWEPGRRPGER